MTLGISFQQPRDKNAINNFKKSTLVQTLFISHYSDVYVHLLDLIKTCKTLGKRTQRAWEPNPEVKSPRRSVIGRISLSVLWLVDGRDCFKYPRNRKLLCKKYKAAGTNAWKYTKYRNKGWTLLFNSKSCYLKAHLVSWKNGNVIISCHNTWANSVY